jgi:glutamate 5-kinase
MGRGGMVTKIRAAQIASRSGANTIIASGDQVHVLRDIGQGKRIGTRLFADQPLLASRKQWMAALPTCGELILDEGAVRVLTSEGKSLLPVGVKSVTGSFTRGEMVACVDESGKEVARGFVNYGDRETTAIIGKPSQQIEALLGFVNEEELIHRDNLVLL